MARRQWVPSVPGAVFSVSQVLGSFLMKLTQGVNRIPAQEAGDGFAKFPDAVRSDTALQVADGVTAPATVAGYAQLYVDAADGDLKVKFGDGTTKTIATDT